MKKNLMAIVAGAAVMFVLGGLMYEVLLAGFYEANLGSATGVAREVPIWWALIVGELGFAALVTYVFRHIGIASASAGLKTGAIFGLLFGLSLAFNLYGVTNWSTITVAFVEPLVTAVRVALAGAAIGWVLGKGGSTESPRTQD
ncbi:MAG: hypothetical protein V3U67_03075 [Gemmatimonadota bacterium]